jgi:hypothetical protein
MADSSRYRSRSVAAAVLLAAGALVVQSARASQVSLLFARGDGFVAQGHPWGKGREYFVASPSRGGRLEFWPGVAGPADRRLHFGIAAGVASATLDVHTPPDVPQTIFGRPKNRLSFVSLLAGWPLAAGRDWGVHLDFGVGIGTFSHFSASVFDSGDGHILGSLGLAAQWRFSRAIGLISRAEVLDALHDDGYGFPYCPGYSLQLGLAFWDE